MQSANGVNIIMEGRFMHGESFFNNIIDLDPLVNLEGEFWMVFLDVLFLCWS